MLNELNKIWNKMLKFEKHKFSSIIKNQYCASKNFKNGYGISVLLGTCFNSNGKNTYEIAILKDNKLCYETNITNDILGYVTKDEIIKIINQVKKLK